MMYSRFLRILAPFFEDPAVCEVCNTRKRKSYGLCEECLKELIICPSKAEMPWLEEKVFPIYTYGVYNKLIQTWYREFKFHGQFALAESFSALLLDALRYFYEIAPFSWVSYIPMSPKKEYFRGYNPVREMAERASRQMRVPCFPVLEKVRNTREQNKVSRQERIKNVENSFRVCQTPAGSGVLVDDIFTSGHTMAEAMETLERIGISVYGVALFRSSMPPEEEKL